MAWTACGCAKQTARKMNCELLRVCGGEGRTILFPCHWLHSPHLGVSGQLGEESDVVREGLRPAAPVVPRPSLACVEMRQCTHASTGRRG